MEYGLTVIFLKWRSRLTLQLVLMVIAGSCVLFGQERGSSAIPARFIVARHSFFDFGPPSDFYEIFAVVSTPDGSLIEKMTLTPGSACVLPAKYEFQAAKTQDSVSALLGGDPCSVPEKKIQHELKRKKKRQLVFSGANVIIQLQCGSRERMIRADILDRDLFDPNPDTPEHTSWTMRLLGRLDALAGPNVMDKPAFQTGKDEPSTPPDVRQDSVQKLARGDFDLLFAGAPDRPSLIFQQSLIEMPRPSVTLSAISPLTPEFSELPKYPPLAKAAGISGAVEFKLKIGADGTVKSVEIISGHPMLVPAAQGSIRRWRFAKADLQPEVAGTIKFNTNCSRVGFIRDPVRKVSH